MFPTVFCRGPNFKLKIGHVPPVMEPIVSGDIILDTEFKVECVYISVPRLFIAKFLLCRKHKLYGNQQSLMNCLKSSELKMSDLDKLSGEQLTKLCKKLDFQNLSR